MRLLSRWIDSYSTSIVAQLIAKIVKRNATGRSCRMSSIPLPLIGLFGVFEPQSAAVIVLILTSGSVSAV